MARILSWERYSNKIRSYMGPSTSTLMDDPFLFILGSNLCLFALVTSKLEPSHSPFSQPTEGWIWCITSSPTNQTYFFYQQELYFISSLLVNNFWSPLIRPTLFWANKKLKSMRLTNSPSNGSDDVQLESSSVNCNLKTLKSSNINPKRHQRQRKNSNFGGFEEITDQKHDCIEKIKPVLEHVYRLIQQ